jgi:hypothetical protein
LDVSLSAGSESSGLFSFLVFGVFVAEEVDGIGGKRSGYSTMVDVPTHL